MKEVRFEATGALTLEGCRGRMRGKGGGRPHPETLRRYVTRGCKLRGGEVVRLKAVQHAGEWLVMPGWLEEFERARLLGGLAR